MILLNWNRHRMLMFCKLLFFSFWLHQLEALTLAARFEASLIGIVLCGHRSLLGKRKIVQCSGQVILLKRKAVLIFVLSGLHVAVSATSPIFSKKHKLGVGLWSYHETRTRGRLRLLSQELCYWGQAKSWASKRQWSLRELQFLIRMFFWMSLFFRGFKLGPQCRTVNFQDWFSVPESAVVFFII